MAEALSHRCLKIYDFITRNNKFLNSHLVDFITNDHWSALSLDLQRELLTLEEGQLLKYFLNTSRFDEIKRSSPAVTKFVQEAYEHSWHKLTSTDDNAPKILDRGCGANPNRVSVYNSSKQKIHKLQISDKKQHEVEIMAEFVANLARSNNARMVVDFGTGKGYLSSLLVLVYELDVVGIDSSLRHIYSATCRDKRLSATFERALEKLQTDSNYHVSRGSFTPVVTTLTSATDLTDITRRRSTVFSGLHACGDLSCSALRHFVKCNSAKAVCIVGCCYHMLEEEFENEMNCAEGNTSTEGVCGFPMSSLLRHRRATIGRNARMLAMQSVERHSVAKPSRSLFFRAVLQVLLRDHVEPHLRFEVGKISVKEGTTFESYVRRALLKLQLHERLQLSSERIESYVYDYGEWEHKIKLYHELRVLMAPSVENLLLLDRTLYLLEQPNVQSSDLTRLFDPLTSPRCLAVVATKS